jgi:hypothetical protein
MRAFRNLVAIAAIMAGIAAYGSPAVAQDYYLNGYPATLAQAEYLYSLGYPPGAYTFDANGYVVDVGDYFAGSGSGEVAPNGDWSHTNPQAGMGVGGSGDCIYTTEGWSNC